jgi:hypothetical protein
LEKRKHADGIDGPLCCGSKVVQDAGLINSTLDDYEADLTDRMEAYIRRQRAAAAEQFRQWDLNDMIAKEVVNQLRTGAASGTSALATVPAAAGGPIFFPQLYYGQPVAPMLSLQQLRNAHYAGTPLFRGPA